MHNQSTKCGCVALICGRLNWILAITSLSSREKHCSLSFNRITTYKQFNVATVTVCIQHYPCCITPPISVFILSTYFFHRRCIPRSRFQLMKHESKLRNGRQMNWLPRRPRRLMGIFRCYGWGPGCSNGPSYFRRQPSKTHVSQAHPDQQSKTFGQETETVKEPEVPQSNPPSEIRVRQPASRFHPFFALTSG